MWRVIIFSLPFTVQVKFKQLATHGADTLLSDTFLALLAYHSGDGGTASGDVAKGARPGRAGDGCHPAGSGHPQAPACQVIQD